MESVQVEIFGQSYSIKGVADKDYIRELAAFVDGRMRDVQKGTGSADVYRTAILAALNIADELYRAKAGQESVQAAAKRSLDRLLEMTSEAAGT